MWRAFTPTPCPPSMRTSYAAMPAPLTSNWSGVCIPVHHERGSTRVTSPEASATEAGSNADCPVPVQESSPAAASVMKNRFKISSFVKLAKNRFPAIPVSPGASLCFSCASPCFSDGLLSIPVGCYRVPGAVSAHPRRMSATLISCLVRRPATAMREARCGCRPCIPSR